MKLQNKPFIQNLFLILFTLFLTKTVQPIVSPRLMDHHKTKLIKKIIDGSADKKELEACLEIIKNAEERTFNSLKKLNSSALKHLETYLFEDFDVDKLKQKTFQSAKNMEEIVARELSRYQELKDHSKFSTYICQMAQQKERIVERRKDLVTFLCNLYCRNFASKNSLESAKINYRKAWESYGNQSNEDEDRTSRLNLLKTAILLRMAINPTKTLSETTDEQIKKIMKKKNELYQIAGQEITRVTNIFENQNLVLALHSFFKKIADNFMRNSHSKRELDLDCWQGVIARVALGFFQMPSNFNPPKFGGKIIELIKELNGHDLQTIKEIFSHSTLSEKIFQEIASEVVKKLFYIVEAFAIQIILTEWTHYPGEKMAQIMASLRARQATLLKLIEV